MSPLEKQKLLSAIASDIKKMVIREVQIATKQTNTKIPSHNSLISNAAINANNIYSDLSISSNTQAFTNENIYKRMKNKVQFKNGTKSSTFVNKGIRKSI